MTTAAAGVILAAGSSPTDRHRRRSSPGRGSASSRGGTSSRSCSGFLVFFISTFAETNRIPFDLPEAEAELVAGYHTEYSSSMKFAMFFMAEYVNMMVASAMTVTLYLGGWTLPGFHPQGIARRDPLDRDLRGQDAFILWVFVWVRWTLPRFRYDQLMRIGWKVLLPLALANLLWVAALVTLEWI